MPLATRTELFEIVPELRAMAAASKTATVREMLNLPANRYAAMAALRRGCGAERRVSFGKAPPST
jgi:hypothetical protein